MKPAVTAAGVWTSREDSGPRGRLLESAGQAPVPTYQPKGVQQKPAGFAQGVRGPITPPVFRPAPNAKTVQPQLLMAPDRRHTAAPSVHEPFPVRNAAPSKTYPAQSPSPALASRRPFVPPVYRPQSKPVGVRPSALVQRKVGWTASGLAVAPGQRNIRLQFPLRRFQAVIQCAVFSAGSYSYPEPQPGGFTPASALAAAAPTAGAAGALGHAAGRAPASGVAVGDVASYGVVQWLEKVGDGLTGDHQPSGAAIKEAIREALHTATLGPLTRSMARNAYAKAVTVVVTDAWHRLYSRTYGGRNDTLKIFKDAHDLAEAAKADWVRLAPQLEADGWTHADMLEVWNALEAARQDFYSTGTMQLTLLH